MYRFALAAALALLAAPALADAVTYRGTIDKLAIVVELSAAPDALDKTSFGRYYYENKGIDIPLHVTAVQRGKISLVEEVACKEDGSNCPGASDYPPTKPPLGAKWELTAKNDGNILEGNFKSGGRNHPVALAKVGIRPFEVTDTSTPADLFLTATSQVYEGGKLTMETAPYDVLKVQDKDTASDETRWGDVAFDYVTDSRTLFNYPRVTDLGGADIAPANAHLEQRDWLMRLEALNCKASVYQGMGWNDSIAFAAGTLGEYDAEQVEVTELTPTVMSWTESGSLFCGGAHPYNHHEFFTIDVKTGEALDMSRVFNGWIAKDFDGKIADLEDARTHPQDFEWGPDKELGDFVRAHYDKADLENPDCPYDDLIDTNLAISFKHDGNVLFAMGGLENAIQACSADLYEAPIADLKELLTPEAADYFPSL